MQCLTKGVGCGWELVLPLGINLHSVFFWHHPVATSNAYSKCLIMGTNKMNPSLVQACSKLFQNVVEKALTD